MSTATELLKSLAGVHASRVGSVPTSVSKAPAVTASAESFATLLEQARSGEIESGVPLRVPQHLGVELSVSQAERLSKAADQAEVQGAGRALVLMDGMGFTMDVATRTLTGVVDPSSAGVLTGLDAVVIAGAENAVGGTKDAKNGILSMPESSLALRPNVSKLLDSGKEGDGDTMAA